jgi:alpha-tubulin suppressor-like RCC1 family protein
VGLRSDGTVVVAGDFTDKERITAWKGSIRATAAWKDIVQIAARYNQIVALTKDGRLVACGFNTAGQCEMEDLMRIAINGY